jgi:hypothetical protein
MRGSVSEVGRVGITFATGMTLWGGARAWAEGQPEPFQVNCGAPTPLPLGPGSALGMRRAPSGMTIGWVGERRCLPLLDVIPAFMRSMTSSRRRG